MLKTAASAERFLKKTKFEDKTTPMALRGSRTKMGEVEVINKSVCLPSLAEPIEYITLLSLFKIDSSNGSQLAAKTNPKDGKKKRLTALERTALEGSAFALRAEAKSKKKK